MTYTLLGPDGAYESESKGELGGHDDASPKKRVYGRMDCSSAKRALDQGGYKGRRVFFADEVTAIASGFRPCGTCMRDRHAEWKRGGTTGTQDYPWLVCP